MNSHQQLDPNHMKNLAAFAAVVAAFAIAPGSVLAHCKGDMCKWPVPTTWKVNGPPRNGPVHGAPGLLWEQQQWCHFDKRTGQRYGHCSIPYPAIYNCKTKTVTFPGYLEDDPIHGLPIKPGDPGDTACRKAGFF